MRDEGEGGGAQGEEQAHLGAAEEGRRDDVDASVEDGWERAGGGEREGVFKMVVGVGGRWGQGLLVRLVMRLRGICMPFDGFEVFQRHVANNGM